MARLILLALMVLAYPFSDYLATNPVLWMFAHASVPHLALNAITLWSFGKPVERELGPAQTLALFMVAALAGVMMQSIVTPHVPVMGASAGILGLIATFAMRKPKVRIGLPLLMFPGPIVLAAIAVLTTICLAFELLPGIAHMAHLAGIVVGIAWSRK